MALAGKVADMLADQRQGDYLVRAVTERVVADIKADLRARIMPEVEREVDAAIDALVERLGPELKAQLTRSPHNMVDELMLQVKTRHIKIVD